MVQEPLVLQASVVQVAAAGPLDELFLQKPSTASSGLSATCVRVGFRYGFLDSIGFSSELSVMLFQSIQD